MQRFHVVPWEERPAIVTAFKDPRLQRIGRQLIHVERPHLLPCLECSEHDRARAIRITTGNAGVPWLTLPKALVELDELLADADPEHIVFLQEHRAYLSQLSLPKTPSI